MTFEHIRDYMLYQRYKVLLMLPSIGYRTVWCLILTIISFFSFHHQVIAQRYTVANYTVDDGLAQSTVYSICEDQNGFIWFSTLGGGVSRFDGVNFVQFNEKNGIISNQIYDVFKDSKGNIWFGTRGGISVYDGYKIKSYSIKDGLKNNLVRVITEDNNGTIWAGTFGGGISKFNEDRFISYSTEEGLISSFVYDIAFDKNNKAYIATRDGLCLFDGKRFTTDSNIPLSKEIIRSVSFDSEGIFWMGTQTKGAASIDLQNITDSNAIKLYNLETGSIANNISDVEVDPTSGDIWFTTLGNGVYMVTDSSVMNFREGNSGISSNITLKINFDEGGNIWIGTLGGGVSKFSKTPLFSYYKEKWLDEKSVRCFYENEKGDLWMGTRNGGIRSEHTIPLDLSFLSGYTVNEIYKSKNQDLWVATDGDGIYKIDKSGNKSHFNTSTGLASNKIFAIAEDDEGSVWFGTYDNGLLCYKNGDFLNFKMQDGLSYDLVFDILHDEHKTLWIATNGGGISTFSGNKFKNYTVEDGIGSNDVWSLEQDVFGNIWVGTIGGGISVFNGSEFKNFTEKDGLISNNVHSLLFDNANNLWIGTEKGIDKLVFILTDTLGKVSYDIYQIEHFGKEEGLQGIETNLNASFKDSKGNLWFGTIHGVSVHDPKKVYFNKKEPQINLTNIKIRFDTVNWKKRYNSEIERWTGLPKNLKLRSFDNYITFEYAAISSKYSKNIKYKVMLEGLDPGWSTPISTNEITYTNLDPGDYVFKVLACNEDGVWTQNPATFTFSVRTPIYEMPLFYVGLSLLAGFLVVLYLRRRSYNNRKEKLLLEKTILERTKELRQEKNNVELQNIEIVSQKRELEIKQRELESKNTQILDSINYAKKLQKAILIDESLFATNFEEYFLLFTPKDIVSGDFYWLREKNNLLYVAAVDCTGHGVPGAFMSIVCNRLLNNAVDEFSFDEPGKMLEFLHVKLVEMMKKGAEDDYIRDGMDLALCIIDKSTNELRFAGAHNHLYLVRDGELAIYEAESKHVGFSMKMEKQRTFKSHRIKLQTDDQLYMFSDGFSDQFGGEKGTKYFLANFQNLIKEISTQPMDQQYISLVNEFLDWKGDREQIDDVLVIGLKIS